MSEEHDSWFKEAFGVDLGQVAQGIKDQGAAVVGQVVSTVTQVVQGVQGAVEGAIDEVTGAATGVVKKVAGAVSPSGGGGGGSGTGGGTGSFPLGSSVGRGGKNAPSDVRAVQTALGIAADGQCGGQTIAAIEAYQRNMGQSKPDGCVDAGGATERALARGGQPAPAPLPAPDGDDSGGLLGQIQKGAAGLLDDANDLGGRAVKGAGEMLADAKEAASDAADAFSQVDATADLKAAFNSGAPLNSPSSVNAQDPSPNLAGGGTASAGDSFFVTGGQKGQLVQRVSDLKGAATAFYDLGKKLEEKGIGGTFEFKDDKLIASAKNVTGTADGLTKLAKAIESWTNGGNKESIEKGSTAVDYVSKIIDAADAIIAVKKLSFSAEEMGKKPNQATVEAWADDVGNSFDKASGLLGLIPSGALPDFVASYYKGLLSAPKNYISAFKTIMHARYDNLDMEAGISKSNQDARNLGTNKIEWEGDLVPLYVKACFQPKGNGDATLQAFMKAHQTIGGVNLYKTDMATGKTLLGAAIAREVPDEEDPNTPSVKVAWMEYVRTF